MTQRGPVRSATRPPMIIEMKPTELATEKTMDRLGTSSSLAIGPANTLQAYMEPMHRLIKQQMINRTQRFLVNASSCFCDNSIEIHTPLLSWTKVHLPIFGAGGGGISGSLYNYFAKERVGFQRII